MSSTNLKCVVCSSQLGNQETKILFEENSRRSISLFCTKMWSTYSNFLGHSSTLLTDWDYILKCYGQAREIPFCTSCRNYLSQLVILQEQLESVRTKISKLVSKISIPLIKTCAAGKSLCFNVIIFVAKSRY